MLTPFLCCSKCSCVSFLFLLQGLGVFVIFLLLLLRFLDSVEIARQHDSREQKRLTLRGFNFPPCLPDMVVVDVQDRCNSDLHLAGAASHMLIAALEVSIISPEDDSFVFTAPMSYLSCYVPENAMLICRSR